MKVQKMVGLMDEKMAGYLVHLMAQKRVDLMVLTTDVQINLGFHLVVMLASLKQKDAPMAARSAYWTMKGSSRVENSAAKMVVMLANEKLKVSQRVDCLGRPKWRECQIA